MKKFFGFLVITAMLSSCQNCSNTDALAKLNWKIVSPTGAPALAFYNYSNYQNFETNSDPSNIIPMMVSEKVDVAVLPTNAGFQAINGKHVNYKIASTITFGNIFIASTGNDKNETMDDDDYIVSFQKGAVPDKIFHYVYGDAYENALHYVSNAQEAAKCLKLGKNLADENQAVDYVVLAEPALTSVISTTTERSIYANLQELYKVKSNNLQIFQASIFVKNSLDSSDVKKFLKVLESDINLALQNPSKIKESLEKNPAAEVLYGINPSVAETVIRNNNGIGLGFALAKDNKESIDLFLSLFGIGKTNEENYF